MSRSLLEIGRQAQQRCIVSVVCTGSRPGLAAIRSQSSSSKRVFSTDQLPSCPRYYFARSINIHSRRLFSTSRFRSGKAPTSGILITGGTSGIGFQVARSAVLQGAKHVRIVTRDSQRGQEAIDRLRNDTETNTDLDYVHAETDEYGDSKIFHHEKSDIDFRTVIHCAGITQTSLLASTRSEDIRRILSVNLESSALLSKSLLKRYMQSCRSASSQKPEDSDPHPVNDENWQIINISSLLALKGGLGTSIYAASKAGLIALTRTTVLEGAEITRRYSNVAPGFRANVVVPGYIETPMTKGISGASWDGLIKNIPAGRFGSPEQVADAVMFLLGNEYANNCVLNLDGGLSAT